ncbi:hypothetical protein EVAR_23079_1 [Eumeta japonica]|uniref:ATP-dependent DNA helicase n=1 Tax=Eumeta variegata TaxID=151549 RepID=A0A4C1VM63_EUMVA|nr:hypothetical protein EVAR_23079_1 [Eumeta japonica]
MTAPNRHMHDALNHQLQREQQYDIQALAETVRTNVPRLNQQQIIAYETLIEAVNSASGRIYFLDAPGGTGKTFLLSLLLARIRSRNDVALALASSGKCSCDSARRRANCTFYLEITIKHANRRNTNMQHRQK